MHLPDRTSASSGSFDAARRARDDPLSIYRIDLKGPGSLVACQVGTQHSTKIVTCPCSRTFVRRARKWETPHSLQHTHGRLTTIQNSAPGISYISAFSVRGRGNNNNKRATSMIPFSVEQIHRHFLPTHTSEVHELQSIYALHPRTRYNSNGFLFSVTRLFLDVLSQYFLAAANCPSRPFSLLFRHSAKQSSSSPSPQLLRKRLQSR